MVNFETISYISVKHETDFKLSPQTELSISRDFPRYSYVGSTSRGFGKPKFAFHVKVRGSMWT